MKRAALLLAAILAVLVWHSWNSVFDHDEIQHLHAAWMVGQGARPFVDFMEQHHPTLWYALAPMAGVIESPHSMVFVARSIGIAGLAIFMALFFAASRLLFPRVTAFWPALMLLASFTFTRNMVEVRPDPWMNLFAFAGLLAWFLFLKGGGLARAFLAGLLFGAAIAVLQKAVVFFCLVGAGSAVLAGWRWMAGKGGGRIASGIVVMFAGAAVPVGILFAAMWRSGLWHDFFFWNYEFNRFFYLQAVVRDQFSIARTLWGGFIRCPALWIAGVAGMALISRDVWKNRKAPGGMLDGKFVVLFVSIAYPISLATSRMPFDHYLIVWLPLVALASAEAYRLLKGLGRGVVYEVAVILMAIELVVILLLYPTNAQQRLVQDYVLKHASPGAAVVIPPPYHPISRRDGVYFWYNGEMIGGVYEDFCEAGGCRGEAIAQDEATWAGSRPEFVFLDPIYPDHWPFMWSEMAKNYGPTEIDMLFKRRE